MGLRALKTVGHEQHQGSHPRKTLRLITALLLAVSLGTACGEDTSENEASNDNTETDAGDSGVDNDVADAGEQEDAGSYFRLDDFTVDDLAHEDLDGRNASYFDEDRAVYFGPIPGAGHAIILLDLSDPERARADDVLFADGDVTGEGHDDSVYAVHHQTDGEDFSARLRLLEIDVEGDRLDVNVLDETEDVPADTGCYWVRQVPPGSEHYAALCGTLSMWSIDIDGERGEFVQKVEPHEPIESELGREGGLGQLFWLGGGVTSSGYVVGIEPSEEATLSIWDPTVDDDESPLVGYVNMEDVNRAWSYDEQRSFVYVAGKRDDDDEDERGDFKIVDVSDPSTPDVVGRWSVRELGASGYGYLSFETLNVVDDKLVLGANFNGGSGVAIAQMNEEGDQIESLEVIEDDELPGEPRAVGGAKVYGDRLYFDDIPGGGDSPSWLTPPEASLMSIPLDDILDR